MKKILFLLLSLMAFTHVMAATGDGGKTLSGIVTDAKDGGALVGVTIYIPELSTGTATDINGHYLLEDLPSREITLQVSYVGHQTIIEKVDLRTTSTLNLVMQESNAMMNEVVVTGLSGNTLLRESSIPASVLSQDMLQRTMSTNIIDALSKQPGMSQITTGGGISKPVIRGLGFNRLAVVNDGMRQEGNQWGAEHGVEVDDQSVSSVEILKGPASLMYGSDALAGVVIFHGDRILNKNTMEGNVEGQYQSNNGLLGYSANFVGNRGGFVWDGRWSQKLAHEYKNKYDHYVSGSQFREQAARLMLGANKQWGYSHLGASFYHLTPGIAEGERSTGFTYGKTLPFQQIHHYKVFSDNAFYVGRGTLSALVGYQQNRRQEFEESRSEPGLDMQLHTLSYDVKYALPEHSGWKLTTGVNGMWQRNNNRGEEFLIPSYQLFDLGVFATSSYRLGKTLLSGGIRYDRRHVHGFELAEKFAPFSRNFQSFSGSLGAVYAVADKMNLRLNLASGFRAPNLGELASNGVHEGTQQYIIGNTQLSPEHSWQIDAGWDYTSSWITAQVAVFANFIRNYIFSHRLAGVITENVPTYQYTQGDARLMGAEVSVDLHPLEPLHIQNAFSFVSSVQRHQPRESKYLPYTPAPKWVMDVRYDLIRDGKTLNNTYIGASMTNSFRQNHFYAADDTETATPFYTLLDLSAGTDVMSHGRCLFTLSVTAQNLLNRGYQDHLSRLKYLPVNPENNRMGIFNMGRNIGAKFVWHVF